jgi:hypothetical protein
MKNSKAVIDALSQGKLVKDVLRNTVYWIADNGELTCDRPDIVGNIPFWAIPPHNLEIYEPPRMIGSFSLPRPLKFEDICMYRNVAVASVSKRDYYYSVCVEYIRSERHRHLFERGLVYDTAEKAELHGRALASFTEISR